LPYLNLSDHTIDHNTVTASKEIDVFYALELLYNVNRFTAPGNITPLINLQFSLISNSYLNYATYLDAPGAEFYSVGIPEIIEPGFLLKFFPNMFPPTIPSKVALLFSKFTITPSTMPVKKSLP